MKKILLLALAVLLNCHVALAESIPVVGSDGSFLFWCTASVSDVQKKIDCCKDKIITQNEYGNTALMWVANCTENKIIIDMLIKAGSNVNEQNKYDGITALMRSMGNSSPEIARYLIKSGAKVNTKDKEGRTALMHAESIKMIEVLIKAGANTNIKDKDGKTALMMRVADNSNPEIIEYLIQSGTDLNIKDKEGRTALMLAKDINIIEMLIKAGADVNAKDKTGWTALTLAQNPEIKNALINAGADVNIKPPHLNEKSALLNATSSKNVQKLINAVEEVNAKKYERGDAILIEAARRDSPKIVRQLIESGADVNIRNYKGETALMKAANSCRLEVVKILIEAGADVNAKDKDGKNAWYKAATYLDGRCPEVEKALKEAGAETSRIKIGVKKVTDGVKTTVGGIIAIPIVLVGATIYSVTQGTSFDKGLGCVLTAGLACGSW